MPMLESATTDERKKTVFGLNYTRSLSIAIDKATATRAKPGWDWQKKEEFKAKLTDFVNQNTPGQKEVAEGMLFVSKNPGQRFEVMKLPWTGDAKDIANQFLVLFKPNVEKVDPNIEVAIEMKGNWIRVSATNKQVPQAKKPEKQQPTGSLALDFSDEESKAKGAK